MNPLGTSSEPTIVGSAVSRRGFLGGSVATLGLFSMGGLLSACGSAATGPSGSAGPAKRGGTLSIAIGDGSPTDKLDPALSTSATAAWLGTMLFSPLVYADLQENISPALAEKLEISNGNTEYTFTLRSGLKFSDGSPLTARDAAWTISRLLDAKLASPAYGQLSPFLDKSGVQVVDDLTLKLKLKSPNPFLAQPLASYNAGVVKANQSTFTNSNLVSSGPFTLKSFTPGQSFAVVRNDNYFLKAQGLPYLDGIQNQLVDPSTVLQALSSGTVQWTDSLNAQAVNRLKGNGQFRCPALQGDERAVKMYFLHMNLKSKPFNDPRVRMAMKLASNRESVRQAVLGNLGTITGDVPVPMSDPAYPKSIGSRPQDIAKAKQLLAEAGYPNGFDVDLPTAEIQPGMTNFSIAYAQVVAAAGIRVHVQQVPESTYYSKIFGQTALFHDYAQTNSGYVMLNQFFQKGGTYNGTGFDDDGKLTALVNPVLTETDKATQTATLSKALAYVADNSGTHIPFMVPNLQTMSSKVQGDLYEHMYAWDKMWINS